MMVLIYNSVSYVCGTVHMVVLSQDTFEWDGMGIASPQLFAVYLLSSRLGDLGSIVTSPIAQATNEFGQFLV